MGDGERGTEGGATDTGNVGSADPTVGVGVAALATPSDAPAPDWRPALTDDNGIAIDPDGLPVNIRLRSLALAEQGATEDHAGIVTPEQIADAVERRAAYDEQYPAIPAKTSRGELEKIAKAEGVDLAAASTNEDRAALILSARPALT